MAQDNMANQRTAILEGERTMQDFGAQLASAISQVDAPLLILMNGDLGAGKQLLVEAYCRGLGMMVPSKVQPTLW